MSLKKTQHPWAGPMIEFDPNQRAMLEDPYSFLKAWREKDPVHWNPVLGRWMVLRYKDIQQICKDPNFSSESRNSKKLPFILRLLLRPLLDGILNSMLFRDAPEHTRLRRSINSAFSPKIVSDLRPKIETIANELLDRVASSQKMDLISEFAFPLPVIVISELLGVDPKDRELFRKWSHAIAAVVVRPQVGILDLLRANQSVKEMRRYFEDLFHQRRQSPQQDLVSQLLGLDENQLPPGELFSMCMLILIAGHETTTNMIGLAVWNLLKHPEELKKLQTNPALIDKAVDELLRFDSSVQAIARVCKKDCEIRGQKIKAGDMLMLSLASANRDPDLLENPDQLNVEREVIPSMTFGHGPHFCLGASLTKLEMTIALKALLSRFPQMRSETKEHEWVLALSHRGLKHLNLILDAGVE